MKPRTKLHHRILTLSNNLPVLSGEQKQWAFKNLLDHVAYRTKTNVSCLDCGNVWDGPKKGKICKCPQCETRLTVIDTKKKKLEQTKMMMAIVSVVEELQLVRYFEVSSYHRSGTKPRQYIGEVVQQWFEPRGKLTIVGKYIAYANNGFSGAMEIRTNISNYYNPNKYNVYADQLYPKLECLPIYKRNGFTSKIKDIYPYSFLQSLLSDSTIETLIKANQYQLASCRAGNRGHLIGRYWKSIKICIRNKYLIKDAITWLDYIDLLVHFKKDILNPKYICPKNLKLQHDILVEKKMAPIRAAQAEKEQKNIELAEKAYLKNKAAYFGIVFSKGDITVKVLESIKEFIAEGQAHKHCVYTNAYYQKADSLILSARIANKPVETIEISLTQMKIVQSRGRGNKASKHNKAIIELVKSNIPVIKKTYLQLKNKAA